MKTVLITGANQGIGFETARQLAGLGYFVYIGSRDPLKGQAAVAALQQQGILNVALLKLDITDPQSVGQARQQLENEAGILDILINNAGIAGPQPQNINTVDPDFLKAVFNTNFFGAVRLTQQLIPLMRKSGLPVIVNVSSELGSLATHQVTHNGNYLRYDAYSASKTALNAFTVLLAEQLKDTPFKINSVTPGYTATNLNDYKGARSPAEAAQIIVQYATLGHDGPTGSFFSQQGPVSW